jgi:hypothetical protein
MSLRVLEGTGSKKGLRGQSGCPPIIFDSKKRVLELPIEQAPSKISTTTISVPINLPSIEKILTNTNKPNQFTH